MTALIFIGVVLTVFWAALPDAQMKQRLQPLRTHSATARPNKPSRYAPLNVGRQLQGFAVRLIPRLNEYRMTDEWLKRLPFVAAALVAGLLLRPAMVLPAVLVLVGATFAMRYQRRRALRLAVERATPMAIDLFRLAITSGSNIIMALRAVAPRVEGPLGDALRHSVLRVDSGDRVADALNGVVPATAESVVPLISALTSAERYGSPLDEMLERMADDARAAQRRQAEKVAQVLGTQLMIPVTFFLLPAFALLILTPMMAGQFGEVFSNF